MRRGTPTASKAVCSKLAGGGDEGKTPSALEAAFGLAGICGSCEDSFRTTRSRFGLAGICGSGCEDGCDGGGGNSFLQGGVLVVLGSDLVELASDSDEVIEGGCSRLPRQPRERTTTLASNSLSSSASAARKSSNTFAMAQSMLKNCTLLSYVLIANTQCHACRTCVSSNLDLMRFPKHLQYI